MSDAPKPSGSLADRITQPSNAATSSSTPGSEPVVPTTSNKDSWADEVASPTVEKGEAAAAIGDAQVDGAAEPMGGSTLHDAQYDVEVKLSDIQGDVTSPLHSITSFEEIGMHVFPRRPVDLADKI